MSPVPVDANGPGLREPRRSPLKNPVYKEPPRSTPDARVVKPVPQPERDTFSSRPEVRGKFIFAGERKVFVRGVTYGPFVPREDGSLYHDAATVSADFAAIARLGANAVRTYTVPPRWLLDVALEHRLRVMVGFGWEQHITFLDERKRRNSIEQKVREGVRQCTGHPAVLSYTIGNEIPSPIVRWYGPDRIERFLTRLP